MVGSLCWLGLVLEFNKKAFIKQILFLSKQIGLIAHALGGFDTVRRLLASGMASGMASGSSALFTKLASKTLQP
ncbi:hypothetical protein [Simplicispira piscis]|jgi:hypothetical protein